MRIRGLFLALAVSCCAICLAACTAEAYDGYQALNDMLRADYSKVILTVTDTFDETTALRSEYAFVYGDGEITVQYRVERFAEIGDLTEQTALKRTLSGEAVIKDGAIVSQSGDEAELPSADGARGLAFRREYFKNATLTGVYLKADVKDPEAFLGTKIVCDDMKVEATFLEVFYAIRISYTSGMGSAVEISYEFSL